MGRKEMVNGSNSGKELSETTYASILSTMSSSYSEQTTLRTANRTQGLQKL